MPRIVAIDFGLKRTGIAVTDPLQIIATALDTVETKEVFNYLQKYLAAEPVECFVVGIPTNLNDSATHATAPAEAFVKSHQKKFPAIPVKTVDERYTSKLAAQALFAAEFSKKDRRDKKNLDKVSATLILQSYLQSQKK